MWLWATVPIQSLPLTSLTSLTSCITTPFLSSNTSRIFPSSLKRDMTVYIFIPINLAKVFNGSGIRKYIRLSHGLWINNSWGAVLQQSMATQNSPFSLSLTLSGNPGKFATTSTWPVFGPSSHNFKSLCQYIAHFLEFLIRNIILITHHMNISLKIIQNFYMNSLLLMYILLRPIIRILTEFVTHIKKLVWLFQFGQILVVILVVSWKLRRFCIFFLCRA